MLASRHVMRTSTSLVAASLVLLTLLTTACLDDRRPAPPIDNRLVVAQSSAPLHLDPRVGADQASARVFQLIYNGLVTKDPAGNLVPDLATAWEILDDGRRYRFYLRPGVTFHDGRPFSAADVVWTYGSILDDTVATTKRASFETVERLEAVDELTVDVFLREPFGALLPEFTPGQGIIPAGSTSGQLNDHPIGTGPFRFVSRTPETVELAAFDAAWQGRPHLDRVLLREVPDATVRALELLKGSVHLVVNDLSTDAVPLFRRNPHFQVVESPGANYAYLGVNLEDPILGDPRVRHALALSLDRQKLVDTLWNGLGVVGETMIPPGLWARHPDLEPIPYDVETAKRLLDQAGYPDPDGDGPEMRFTVTYKTSTSEPYVLQAQILQSMAAQAGIGIEIRSYEFATFYDDVRKGNFQLFSLIRTGIIDPNIYRLVLHSDALPPNGQNRGHYRNARFDALVEEGARLTLPEERMPIYLEVQEILKEDLPYISLYTRVNFAVMPADVEGYVNYPSGELLGLRSVWWR